MQVSDVDGYLFLTVNVIALHALPKTRCEAILADVNQQSNQSDFIDLRELSRRVSLSSRTLRAYVHDPEDPLIAYQCGTGKLLFFWREAERWIRRHRVHPAALESSLADRADRIIKEFKDG